MHVPSRTAEGGTVVRDYGLLAPFNSGDCCFPILGKPPWGTLLAAAPFEPQFQGITFKRFTGEFQFAVDDWIGLKRH